MGFFPHSGMRLSTPFGQFGDICRMIKIEHSIFALPYAWGRAVLAGTRLALCAQPDFSDHRHDRGALIRHGLQPAGRSAL